MMKYDSHSGGMTATTYVPSFLFIPGTAIFLGDWTSSCGFSSSIPFQKLLFISHVLFSSLGFSVVRKLTQKDRHSEIDRAIYEKSRAETRPLIRARCFHESHSSQSADISLFPSSSLVQNPHSHHAETEDINNYFLSSSAEFIKVSFSTETVCYPECEKDQNKGGWFTRENRPGGALSEY